MNAKNFHKKKKDEITLSPMTKAPKPSENKKSQEKTQRRQQKLRLHNDCGPNWNGQLE